MGKLNEKLPVDKLLDISESQYKVAVAAFRRVEQIGKNNRLRSMLSDSKRIPIVALGDVLEGRVKVVEDGKLLNPEKQI